MLRACRSHIFHSRHRAPWFQFLRKPSRSMSSILEAKTVCTRSLPRTAKPDMRSSIKVGESSTEKDWPAYQPGSFDSLVGRSTMQHDWTEVHA